MPETENDATDSTEDPRDPTRRLDSAESAEELAGVSDQLERLTGSIDETAASMNATADAARAAGEAIDQLNGSVITGQGLRVTSNENVSGGTGHITWTPRTTATHWTWDRARDALLYEAIPSDQMVVSSGYPRQEITWSDVSAETMRVMHGYEPETQEEETMPRSATRTRGPRLTTHPVVQSLKFRIAQAPVTPIEGGYTFHPTKCVVENREAGIRLVVTGPATSGSWMNRREQKYNIVGYGQYPDPPEWLLTLCEEARRRAREGDGNA